MASAGEREGSVDHSSLRHQRSRHRSGSFGSSTGRRLVLQLRTATRNHDIAMVRRLLQVDEKDIGLQRDTNNCEEMPSAVDGNMTSSQRSAAVSALSLAVRCGHLDVVDSLISMMPQSDIDLPGSRTGQSALDEATVSWFRAATGESRRTRIAKGAVDPETEARDRHDIATRYRILRRLLEAGAGRMSVSVISTLMTSSLDTFAIRRAVDNLVKVVSDKGSVDVCNVLLGVLVWYPIDGAMLYRLLNRCTSNLFEILKFGGLHTLGPLARSIPLENAIALVRASNDPQLLDFIDFITSVTVFQSSSATDNPYNTAVAASISRFRSMDNISVVPGAFASSKVTPIWTSSSAFLWPVYRTLLTLLTLSGHRLCLSVLDWLLRRHAAFYRWIVLNGGAGARSVDHPTSLLHSARLSIRRRLRPNVVAAIPGLEASGLPPSLRDFILFSDVSKP